MSQHSEGGSYVPQYDYTRTGATDTGGTYASATLTSPTITGTAAMSTAGTITLNNTLTGSAYGVSSHEDELYSKITLTPATTVSAVNGLNPIRGEVNLTTGKTLSGTSFVTGVYGRANINGTVAIGSGDLSAVYGKFDLNGSTLTSGHIAPVQANIVNPGATAATAGVSLFYGESASGTPIGNGIELYMAAAYLMKLTQVSGGTYVGASAPTSLAKSLKVSVDGTDYYIGLYTSPS